jgi:hypothetical protein
MPSPTVRKAWLDLYGDGTVTIQLENPSMGYFCSSLDLGWPVTRDVVNNKPDHDGTDDRTSYLGARTVTANLTAAWGAGAARMDSVAPLFAPYMVPTARPQLHYILDRPGTPERVMTVRGAAFSAPVAGASEVNLQLQFIAPDPDVKDPATQTVVAWAASSSNPGRLYPLTFPRVYPSGGSAATLGVIRPAGDLPIRPQVKVYGPITAPVITFAPRSTGQQAATIYFLSSFIINAGHYVLIDTASKTAYLDGLTNQSVATSIDWQRSTWPVINPVPPASDGVNMGVSGGSTTPVAQVIATWQNRYLI